VVDYVARLVRATRPKYPNSPDFVRRMVDWGAGPRAGQFLIRGGQAMSTWMAVSACHRRHQEGRDSRVAPSHQHQFQAQPRESPPRI